MQNEKILNKKTKQTKKNQAPIANVRKIGLTLKPKTDGRNPKAEGKKTELARSGAAPTQNGRI